MDGADVEIDLLLSEQSAWRWIEGQVLAWISMNQYQHLLELMCVLLLVYFYRQRAYKPRHGEEKMLTTKEIDDACKRWNAVPLARPPTKQARAAWERNSIAARSELLLTSDAGPTVSVRDAKDGTEVEAVNFASLNFPGLQGDRRVKDKCAKTMKHYGCGSCGPRGFYGTMDVHLDCERQIAKFCGGTDAIIYSFGTATMSSVIPAFCKRGDIVICDEGVSYAVQAGCRLCRSDIKYFAHNDMEDLRRILEENHAKDRKDPKRPLRQRRFIIVEALYTNYGDFAPLDEIVALKNQYKFRLMLDESNSLGVTGKTGHGSCEAYGIPRSEVDVTVGDFAPTMGTIGGFCVGGRVVVNHQRLSGAGYCFSASQPPYLATAAITAMEVMEEEGAERVDSLRKNTHMLRDLLREGVGSSAEVLGHRDSPLILLKLTASGDLSELQELTLRKQKEFLAEGIYVSCPLYVPTVRKIPPPTLRVSVSAAHTETQIKDAAAKICGVLTRG